jgi:hypothetical protein
VRIPLRLWLAAGLAAALLSTATRAITRRSAADAGRTLPSGAEVDSLATYLQAGPTTPRVDDYSLFLPATPVPAPTPADPAPAAAEIAAPPAPRLEGVLEAGGQRIAVVDGRTVAVGDRLPDGSTVSVIEQDRVVIHTPAGALRTLSLSPR